MGKITVSDKIVMKKISEIKPYVRNPRKNDKTVELLVKVIPTVGFNVPILIDKNGIIVKGHARYSAAIKLGMKEVPCVVTDADDEAIKLDRLSDNKISEFSKWDDEELLHELDSLALDDIDLTDLGFPVEQLDTVMEELGAGLDDEDGDDEETEKEREERYRKYLEEHKSPARSEEEVTERDIEKAMAEQSSVAEKPKKYYKVVCPECGKIMFIAENEALFTLRPDEM